MFRSNLKWIKWEMEIVIDLMMNFSVGSVRMQQWKMRHLQSLSLTKCRRHRLTTGDKTGGCEYNLKCWLMMDYWRIPFHFMMERWYVKTSRLSRVLKSKKESSTRDGKMLELHMTLIDFSRQSGLGFSFYFPLPPPPPRRLLILYVIFFVHFFLIVFTSLLSSRLISLPHTFFYDAKMVREQPWKKGKIKPRKKVSCKQCCEWMRCMFGKWKKKIEWKKEERLTGIYFFNVISLCVSFFQFFF